MAPYLSFLRSSPSLEGLSPLALEEALSARDTAQNSYTPGHGSINATNINNNAIFALFGILGAGFVITSFWFFFWAKNGGFRWRKGDWEDYKSTVLRRKGPNGTILSGATKSTRLGNGSIVGSQGSMDTYKDLEKGSVRGGKGTKQKKSRGKQVKNSEDVDVRAYRHEKVAKVGGINREADGSHYEPTNSEASSHGGERHTHANRTSRRDFSYVPGTESNFSTESNDSRRPLRKPSAKYADEQSSTSRTHRPIRQVPRSTKHYSSGRTSNSGSYTDHLDFGGSHHEGSTDGSEQIRNTKSYHHPIAGLGRNANSGFPT
ncbi:MAG: hypothetical protein GOMPHAMPRED_007291 [Gomphillus americanus]|uniref:Endosomal spry domain-containing protein n=1 Tax=Gomphillus americanus TaxID=1940652 RepID=A0A8H3EQU2_9LECA|nr:MAG: hypothetical protein GOMPHAMPRED_007291 [Gomphillus americanus]